MSAGGARMGEHTHSESDAGLRRKTRLPERQPPPQRQGAEAVGEAQGRGLVTHQSLDARRGRATGTGGAGRRQHAEPVHRFWPANRDAPGRNLWSEMESGQPGRRFAATKQPPALAGGIVTTTESRDTRHQARSSFGFEIIVRIGSKVVFEIARDYFLGHLSDSGAEVSGMVQFCGRS